MDAYEFSVSILGILVWPLVILTSVFLFRKPISDIGKRLTKLTYRDLRVDFGETLTRVEHAVSQETAEKVGSPAVVVAPAISARDRFERLAEISPTAAVVETWIDVENMLNTMALHHGLIDERVKSSSKLIKLMGSAKVIDHRTAAILDDLRSLRNAAAHGDAGRDISTNDALRFRALSDNMISILASSAD